MHCLCVDRRNKGSGQKKIKRKTLTAIVFVLPVLAVAVVVALPPQRDALAVLAALKLVAGATLPHIAVACEKKETKIESSFQDN
jgi:hypothetical protein